MGLLAGNGIEHNQLTTTQGGAQMETGGQQSSEVANLKARKVSFLHFTRLLGQIINVWKIMAVEQSLWLNPSMLETRYALEHGVWLKIRPGKLASPKLSLLP